MRKIEGWRRRRQRMWLLDGITNSMDMCCVLGCSVMPILYDPMDCSLPGSSIHGDSLVKNTGMSCMPPPGYLPNPGIESRSLTLQTDSLPAELPGKPSMGMNLGKIWEMERDREPWHAIVHGVAKSWTQLGNWTKTIFHYIYVLHLLNPLVCWWAFESLPCLDYWK